MKQLLIIFGFLLASFSTDAPTNSQGILLPEVVINVKTYDKEIFDSALEFGADSSTAKILVAQARLESGSFTNRLTAQHNNVFSMQHARKRKTTSLGAFGSAEKRPKVFASYRDVRDAVRDLFFYFEAKNIKLKQPSLHKYVLLLKKKHYFESSATSYEKALKKNLKKVKI